MSRKLLILTFHEIVNLRQENIYKINKSCIDLTTFNKIVKLASDRPNILLTFDDGYKSQLEMALPILLRNNLRAVFFIPTGMLGKNGYMGYDDVKVLVKNGMAIGSHGVRHVNWRNLGPEQLQFELTKSKIELEELCRHRIFRVACPYGGYNRRVLLACKAAGYSQVYTSDCGWASDSWLLSRNTITYNMSDSELNRILFHKPNFLIHYLHQAKIFFKSWSFCLASP